MKTHILLLFILTLSLRVTIAQNNEEPNIVRTKGEAQVEWFDEMESKKEAQARAERLARINALEKAFGTVVIQGNTTYMKNTKTGEKTETKTVFNMIGNTMVKGEIIEVLKKKFKEDEKKERIDGKRKTTVFITCELTVLAKELTEPKLQIETFPLNKPMKNFKTTTFFEGDDLFLYFRSPVSGYVTVYLDDNTYANRLLPYQTMPAAFENGMPVKADKEYIFFSTAPEHNYFDDEFFEEDAYELYAENQKDLNRIFVIFSKEPLDKPLLEENINKEIAEELAKENYTIPKATESEKFQRWLIKNHQIRRDLQVENIIISIEKIH